MKQKILNDKDKYNNYLDDLLIVAKKRRLIERDPLDHLIDFLKKLPQDLKDRDIFQSKPFQTLVLEYKKLHKNEKISVILLRLASHYYSQDKKDFTTAAHAMLNKGIYPKSNYTGEELKQINMIDKLIQGKLIKNFKSQTDVLQDLLAELLTDKPVDILLQSYCSKISASELYSLLPSGIYACYQIYYSSLDTLLMILVDYENNLHHIENLESETFVIEETVSQQNSNTSSYFHQESKINDESSEVNRKKHKTDVNVNRDYNRDYALKFASLSTEEERRELVANFFKLKDFLKKELDNLTDRDQRLKFFMNIKMPLDLNVNSILSNLSVENRLAFGDAILNMSPPEDNELHEILRFLPESIRLEFVFKHQKMIKDGEHIPHILGSLPLPQRLPFIKHYRIFFTDFYFQPFTSNSLSLDSVVERLHPSDVLECIMLNSSLITEVSHIRWLADYLLDDEDLISLILHNAHLITKQYDLVELLSKLQKPSRLLIVRKFKSLIDKHNLVEILALLSDSHCSVLVNEMDHLITSLEVVLEVMKYLPKSHRLSFVDKHRKFDIYSQISKILDLLSPSSQREFINTLVHRIKYFSELNIILSYLPENERFAVAVAHKHLITLSSELKKILSILPETKRSDFMFQVNVKFNSTFDLLNMLTYLPTNRFAFLMRYQHVIRDKKAANFDSCLSNNDRAVIGPKYQQAGTLFKYIMSHLNDSDQKLFANEFKEGNNIDEFLFKNAFPSKAIDFSIPYTYGFRIFDGKGISYNPTCNIELESGNEIKFENSRK